MKMKIAIVLATTALFCMIGIAFGANWYFSNYESSTVIDTNFVVTMNPFSSTLLRGSTLSISGTVTLSGNPVAGITVSLEINGALSGDTALTDGSGYYVVSHYISELNGTVLNFRAGIYQ